MSNDEQLVVSSVHMYPMENAKLHHTDRFEVLHRDNPTVVLRRAQPFHLVIGFSGRVYDLKKDLVQLVFTYGNRPNIIKGTKAICTMSDKRRDDVKAWHARTVGKDENSMNVEVKPQRYMAFKGLENPISVMTLSVKQKAKNLLTGRVPINFPIAFAVTLMLMSDPDDQVYMPDERLLDEYVLNDIGKIWVGPYGSSKGREWIFGQFDAVALPAVDLMMSRSNVAPVNRGNPIYVTRAISKLVNSNDDLGVLQGRWNGNYEDGTAPAAWTGSVPILEEYLDTGTEVKYGQCWVFAGVVATVCRALGIPCRVVSNLVSAHDANASLTIDRYYTADMEMLDYDPTNPEGDDSIWNYHVWNDVWMARPDLPKGYGGWQAIDATPQETSDGVYQCGPASVEAVKCGAVGFNYDVSFLLSTVNADLVRWKEDDSSEYNYSKIDSNKYHIGRMILTKKPWIYDPNGDRDRDDVTEQYKNKEGTKAERLTLRASERAKRFYMLPAKSREDIDFELVNLDEVKLGDGFSITVNIHNRSDNERSVQAVLSAASIYYTGIKAHVIKKATGDFKVGPKAKEMLRLTVKPEEYLEKLVEYCNMKIYAIATVVETNETWGEEDDFQVMKPNLQIKINGIPVAQKPCAVSFSFQNPLKKALTGCIFQYAGPGLVKNTPIPYRDIQPEEEVKVEHSFIPQRAGRQKLVGTFSSKELLDITGSVEIEVAEDEE
ncbi:Hemocyte protein-glutamine gamma-glutamyltransferase [Zootermopsis nevadensis]|uniref:Hemocyte protein-glutamine gamma-glutamyltransferase n=2 Tax=Zootermopsis nevadensis TaxID=136037 RepID=A0A067RI89_ZOONE|nr:Hemocyte protein-glutamine gamma-glutamyltransferase [Zootermopsis nevadensis]